MNPHGFQLTVYGTRGSMAVSGPDRAVFGGATSCYLAEIGKESIFLDAGSGLINAPVNFPKPPVILISHLHLDHVLGLGMYPRLATKGCTTKLYMPAKSASEARRMLDSLYSPPFWPLSLTEYDGNLPVKPMRLPFRIGNVTVDGMPGNHPGDSTIFRLTGEGKSLVYVTDYEHEDTKFLNLISFAREADLLMYDGQFTTKEYKKRKGFGHSTAEKGLELMEKSGAKQLLLIHHEPRRTDRELLAMEAQLGRDDVHFARQGERIVL